MNEVKIARNEALGPIKTLFNLYNQVKGIYNLVLDVEGDICDLPESHIFIF